MVPIARGVRNPYDVALSVNTVGKHRQPVSHGLSCHSRGPCRQDCCVVFVMIVFIMHVIIFLSNPIHNVGWALPINLPSSSSVFDQLSLLHSRSNSFVIMIPVFQPVELNFAYRLTSSLPLVTNSMAKEATMHGRTVESDQHRQVP